MVPQDPSASAAAPGNARPDYDLEAWRRRVPVLRTSIPLCHCSHSPLIDGIREAVAGYLDSWDRDVMDWDAWMEQVNRAKAAFALLIGASPGEISSEFAWGPERRRTDRPGRAEARLLRAQPPPALPQRESEKLERSA